MTLQSERSQAALAPRFVIGIATGVLLSLLLAISPFAAVIAIVLVGLAVLIRLVGRKERGPTMVLAGTLVGIGAVMAYGVAMTVQSCAQTDNFCGDANVWPLAALAAVSIGVGIAGSIAVARR
jgi:hypothetical protein